jgi:hypothetical protein|tara:strand:+ start:6142 stop:6333 length:192 start_codon:yes stop_codon:yes gene_type:complete
MLSSRLANSKKIGGCFIWSAPHRDPTAPAPGIVSSNNVGDKWQSSKLDESRRKQNILSKKKKK